jgi:hypothetical protein
MGANLYCLNGSLPGIGCIRYFDERLVNTNVKTFW